MRVCVLSGMKQTRGKGEEEGGIKKKGRKEGSEGGKESERQGDL